MSSSFDLPEVQSFTVGTEGQPGERVFYLQAVTVDQVVTLRLEKQQVIVLADYLGRILSSYDMTDDEIVPTVIPDLYQPVISEWVVGSMMVAIDETHSKIIVIAEEIDTSAGDEPGAASETGDFEPTDLDSPDLGSNGAEARFGLTPDQVDAFVRGASGVIEAGRPPCVLCGRPINADGHFCPRLN